MTSDTCTFCGAQAHGWCGVYAWCNADSCWRRFLNATYEPCFELYRPCTPLGRAWVWFMARGFTILSRTIPARWIVWERYRDTLRQKFAVWAWGGSWYWSDREHAA